MTVTTMKSTLTQIVIAALLLALLAIVATTTFENLERLGVQSGFGFLTERAGFDINQSLIGYSPDAPFYKAFLVAILNTLLLAGLSIVVSTAMGCVVALFRLSGVPVLQWIATGFIEIFRNIPALLQIFLVYFVVLRALPSYRESFQVFDILFVNNRGFFFPGVEISGTTLGIILALAALALTVCVLWRRKQPEFPVLKAVAFILVAAGVALFLLGDVTRPLAGRFGYDGGWQLSPELAALVLGLAVYNASYIAEIVRGGFEAVPRGQIETAEALGLKPLQVVRHVVAPQAMRVIIPPMTNIYINILKSTSLGAAIGYPEIVSVMIGTSNNLVGRPVEIMFITFCLYSTICLVAAAGLNRLNARHNRYQLG